MPKIIKPSEKLKRMQDEAKEVLYATFMHYATEIHNLTNEVIDESKNKRNN